MSTSFLYWEAQNWGCDSRCGLTSADQALSSPTGNILHNAAQDACHPSLPETRVWLTFSTLLTKDPGLSAAELLSSCLPASMLWGCARCCANILNAAASRSHDPQPTWGYYVSWTDHSFSPSLLALGLIGFSCTIPKCFLFIVFHTVRFVTWFPVLLEPRGSRRIRHFRTW